MLGGCDSADPGGCRAPKSHTHLETVQVKLPGVSATGGRAPVFFLPAAGALVGGSPLTLHAGSQVHHADVMVAA